MNVTTHNATEINPALAPWALIGDLSAEGPKPLETVLHVINGEHFSGAERVQQLLGKRLGELGFDARFACVKPNRFPDLCGLAKRQVVECPMRGRFDFSVVSKIAKYAGENSVALLHAHTPRTAMITSVVALRTRLPWVYHVHSPTSRDSTRGIVNRINTWIESYSIRNCNALLTVSKSLAAEMRRLGVSDDRLTVVPNGVPAIDPIDTESRMSQSTWRLGIVALMRPRKGVEVALKSMQQLKQAGRPVTLELIGGFETEEYQRFIMQMVADLKIQDVVEWTGFTSDVPEALRRLDALLLPSLFGEGMPMVVLEAMAAAVPVVATRVEGTPEVIRDGVEGFLAEPQSPESLTARIEHLIADRNEWKQMSQRAMQRHREDYNDLRMAEGVAKAYARVLATRKH